MSHYAWLDGSASREEAEGRYGPTSAAALPSPEPELEAAYRIPLFWLACFAEADALPVRRHHADGTVDAEELLVLWAPVPQVLSRLQSRRGAMLALVPVAFEGYYDEWVRFIQSSYGRGLLLRTEDLLSMEGYGNGALRLRAALRWLAPADEGGRLTETSALRLLSQWEGAPVSRPSAQRPADVAMQVREQLTGSAHVEGSYGTLLWPPHARDAELRWAQALPDEASDAVSPEHRALVHMVRHGVRADTPGAGLRLALGKLSGSVPMGADAPSPGMRKALAGAGELLAVLKYGLAGLVFMPVGLMMLWVGARAPWSLPVLGTGAALGLLGAWASREAWRAWRALQAIRRA